ncbi:glycoside hydrolase family 2 TIM barrel-domain containing protein [Streptomyces sp. NPDC051976]|uniref:glycoside hydrolase family 2 TIM barrel-domain containing protein n=1 Tax=Streptomyces sp. NPDC051976 TaxID=3154947 RepID=UPI00343CC897
MTELARRAIIATAAGTAAASLLPGARAAAATPVTSGGPAPAGTYAVSDSPRVTWSLNQGWRFMVGDPTGAYQTSFDDSAWDQVDVPNPLALQPVDIGPNNLQSAAWFRRRVTVPTSARGQRLLLRFEGAMQVCDVYLNGIKLGSHYGGYTPFGWDVTDSLQPGTEAVLAVRVDNTDQPLVPPGKPESGLDMLYLGGLYRDVWLIALSPVHITDPIIEGRTAGGGVFVTTPTVSQTSATVNVASDIVNKGSAKASVTVVTTLLDATGTTVATTTSTNNVAAGATTAFTATLTISNPQLWTPDTPYLYTTQVQVTVGTQTVDQVSTRFGARTIAWSYSSGFSLNGKNLLVNGTNRGHQEYPYVGYAAPASQQRRDALLIRQSGANFVRSAHYPPHPAFLDACDEVGLMVLNCVPGWQNWNSDPVFAQRSHDDFRTMIRRDRNHPSIILWEATLNETYSGNSPFESDQERIAQEEYPGDEMCTYGGNGTFDAKIFNVQNAYWVRADAGSTINTSPGAALLLREYGDYEFGGEVNNTSRTTRADGPDAMLATVHNKQSIFSSALSPGFYGSGVALAGLATWSATDYNRGLNSTTCLSGLMDLFRIPKFACYFYQSQRDPNVQQSGVDSGPMVYVANYWNKAASGSTTTTIANTAVDTGLNLWRYTGNWQGTSGDNSYSNHTGDTAVVHFTGTSVTLYGDLDPVHGIGAVTLDSQAAVNVDFYASSRRNQVAVWSATGLTDGPHTLTVKVTGTKNSASGNTFVSLTKAAVTSAASGNVTIVNTAVDTGDNLWRYTGNWQGTSGDNSYSNHTGDTAVVHFTGTSVTLYGDLDPVHGIGAVTLDSQAPVNVDFYASSRRNQVAVWSTTGLTDGPHTLTVKVTGTKNSASGNTFVSLTKAVITKGSVVVFSNCDEVELSRNGTVVARQKPDTGGINANIPHPPFTFSQATFQSGALKATGYLNGTAVVSQTVNTPGAAAKLKVDVDLPGGQLVADGTDFAVVRATVTDAQGNIVPDNGVSVTFSVSGAGQLIGDSTINANPATATAGIAAALVRATRTSGTLTITASATGLTNGTATVTTTTDTTSRI